MQVMKVTAIALPWLICCVPILIFIKFLLQLTKRHLCVSCAILIHWIAWWCTKLLWWCTKTGFQCGRRFVRWRNRWRFPQTRRVWFNARRSSPTPHPYNLIAPDEANPMRLTCHSHSLECLGRKAGRNEAKVLSPDETQDVSSARLVWFNARRSSPTLHSLNPSALQPQITPML